MGNTCHLYLLLVISSLSPLRVHSQHEVILFRYRLHLAEANETLFLYLNPSSRQLPMVLK